MMRKLLIVLMNPVIIIAPYISSHANTFTFEKLLG